LLLFPEKEEISDEEYQMPFSYIGFLGSLAPQTPWVGFAELWASNLLRSKTTLLLLFPEKEGLSDE
jgi:hypothetical protein